MRYRLPSLTALRAFEAVARHGSMSAASDELSVTPGAVSRHIALLEAHFDCRLFDRQSHGVALTEKGRKYFREISSAFDKIDTASQYLKGTGKRTHVSVHTYTTFATDWLVPRLSDFHKRHKEVNIRLDTSVSDIDFAKKNVDVGLVRSDLIPAGVDCTPLYRPLMFPVVGPQILESGPPLEHMSDLSHHTLLYSEVQRPNWQKWLDAAGVKGVDLDRGLFFENSSQTYRAAQQGAGIALGQHLFVADDIEAGRLIVPFPLALEENHTFMLAVSRRCAKDPDVIIFRDWLIKEIAAAKTIATATLNELELLDTGSANDL